MKITVRDSVKAEAIQKETPYDIYSARQLGDKGVGLGSIIPKGSVYEITGVDDSIPNNFGFSGLAVTVRGTLPFILSGFNSRREAEADGWDFSGSDKGALLSA